MDVTLTDANNGDPLIGSLCSRSSLSEVDFIPQQFSRVLYVLLIENRSLSTIILSYRTIDFSPKPSLWLAEQDGSESSNILRSRVNLNLTASARCRQLILTRHIFSQMTLFIAFLNLSHRPRSMWHIARLLSPHIDGDRASRRCHYLGRWPMPTWTFRQLVGC